MADIKKLLEEAERLNEAVVQKETELEQLQTRQREAIRDNLKGIVYPFVRDVVQPVHALYVKVISRQKMKGSAFIKYTREEEVYRKQLSYGDLSVWLSLLSWHDSLLINIGIRDRHVFGSSYIELMEKNLDSTRLEWFDFVGTVEKAQSFCEELKKAMVKECDRLVEMLTYENDSLSETISEIKEELGNASAVKVEDGEELHLILNGKTYICTPAE